MEGPARDRVRPDVESLRGPFAVPPEEVVLSLPPPVEFVMQNYQAGYRLRVVPTFTAMFAWEKLQLLLLRPV